MPESTQLWIVLALVLTLGLVTVVTGRSCPLLAACFRAAGGGGGQPPAARHLPANPNDGVTYQPSALREIYLAGGCFWGVEAYLARIHGVAQATSGYANGRTENPTYEDVCYRGSGHAETVQVHYDPERITLSRLLHEFFQIIDPTTENRQGNDVGSQYRTGIYYVDPVDVPIIEAVVAEVAHQYDRPIVTEIMPLEHFFPAEEYHQRYLEKNPGGYCHVDFSRLPDGNR